MKANELRIGNYVKYLDKIIFIDTIYYDSINVDLHNDNQSYHIDDIKPIELTEEILLKCGFKNIKEYTYIILSNNLYGYVDELEFFFEPNEDVCITFLQKEISQNDKSAVFFRNIRYLHELQNLYFALTNEELGINL